MQAVRAEAAESLREDPDSTRIILFNGAFYLTRQAANGNVARFRSYLVIPPQKNAMSITGAEIVMRCLQEEGVEYV
ncbi:MAG TPA: hypothetical protein VD867_10205, partial [Burkholderiales bacterium]|nr:hypothetical protein [Burkholderiales bacterium]